MKVKKRRQLTFFDNLILWVNILAAAALLVSYLAPMADPRKYWVFAFFGLAYPVLLLINVLLLLYWLVRKNRIAFLPLAAILIGWTMLKNHIGLRFPTAEAKPARAGQFRVMAYNVHGFKKFGEKNDISTRDEILDIIRHEQPDILAVEEMQWRKRGRYAMVDSLKSVMQVQYCIPKAFVGETEFVGMGLFSRYPIIHQDVIRLTAGPDINQCVYADINKSGRVFRVYQVHLQSINFGPSDYQYLHGLADDGRADMPASRRIGSKLKQAFKKRAEQVALLKQHMAACPYPYIIMGDFNDTPSSYAVSQLSAGMKNAFCEKGSGLGRTYNGDFPNYQIDYILAQPAFDMLSYGVIRKKLSDHYPVYSDLCLK